MTDEWQTTTFRQNVANKLNEAITSSGMSTARNATEMENHFFQKARSREEYLAFVTKIILHVRGIENKNKPQPNADIANQQQQQQQQSGISGGTPGMPDPINALQNLARDGTRNTMQTQMMSQQMGGIVPPGAQGPQINQNNVLQNLMHQQQQRPQLQNRGPQSLGSQGAPIAGNMPANNLMTNMGAGPSMGMQQQMPSNVNQQMAAAMAMQQMNPQQQAQQQQLNAMGQIGAGGHSGQGQMPPGMQQQQNMNIGMNAQMNPNQMNQLLMNRMAGGVGAGPNVGGLMPGNQMGTNINQNVMNSMSGTMAPGSGIGGSTQQQPQMANANIIVGQQQMNNMTPQGQGQQPNIVPPPPMNPMLNQIQQQVGGPQHGGIGVGQQMRKQQEIMMAQSGVVGSGGPYQNQVQQGNAGGRQVPYFRKSPSPSVPSPVAQAQGPSSLPNMVPSPALAPSPQQQQQLLQQRNVNVMAPSPSNTNLNTPQGGQGGGAVQSPLNNPQEEALYREKYRQLTKYIEPLKRMVARMGNDEEKLLKMNRLLEILCNPNSRIPLDTLLKCEKALEKMDFKSYTVIPGSGGCVLPTQTNNATGPINNPLLEVVTACLQSPMGNHTLQRTFRPCLESLFGPDIKNLPPKQMRMSSSQDDDVSYHSSSTSGNVPEVPHVLQGEIARLDQKFKVSLDPSASSQTPASNKIIKIICCLDDKHLPCVPPIGVSIPEDYPMRSPSCSLNEQEYNTTKFLIMVQKALMSRISMLPTPFSLSHLLDTWEMSVRQACSPTSGHEMAGSSGSAVSAPALLLGM